MFRNSERRGVTIPGAWIQIERLKLLERRKQEWLRSQYNNLWKNSHCPNEYRGTGTHSLSYMNKKVLNLRITHLLILLIIPIFAAANGLLYCTLVEWVIFCNFSWPWNTLTLKYVWIWKYEIANNWRSNSWSRDGKSVEGELSLISETDDFSGHSARHWESWGWIPFPTHTQHRLFFLFLCILSGLQLFLSEIKSAYSCFPTIFFRNLFANSWNN